MSRIGKQPITIKEGVTVNVKAGIVSVKSAKAEVTQVIPESIQVEVKDNQILVSIDKPTKQSKALHGLTRSLIANMIIGVTEGFSKTLELQGTGYRVNPQGKDIELSLGFSHPVKYQAPEGIKLEVKDQKLIVITGVEKQLVGQVAAKIRNLRPPDPYKGKGIRYQGETVKLKPGKAAKAAGTE